MKSSLYLILVGLISLTGYSQEFSSVDPFYTQENIPSSPETSTLGTYGAISNNPYNGKANVNVPIYTIEWEGISIPIALNYDTGGVQVASEASWVGLNWQLSTNFGIHRKVMGQDDFSTKITGNYDGALKNGFIYNDLLLEWEEGASRPYLDLNEILNVHHSFGINNIEGRASSHMDTQPDIFTINVFGKSYTFILNKKGISNIIEARVFNSNHAKITFDLNNMSFTLIDENGFQFFFSTKEINTTFSTVQGDTPEPPSSYQGAFQSIFATAHREDTSIITNWLLDKVVSPRNRELNFTYSKGLYFTFPQYSKSMKGRDHEILHNWPNEQFNNISGNYTNYSVSTTIIENNYLRIIQGDFGEVKFNIGLRLDLSTGKTIDILSSGAFGNNVLYTSQSELRSCHGTSGCSSSAYIPAKLENIEVFNIEGKRILNSDFSYSYFNDLKLNNTDKERFLRLKLDEVKINSKLYYFDYIDQNMLPGKDSNGIDFWGFANGKTNSESKIPRIGRFITSRISDSYNNHSIGQSFIRYDGADRSSSFDFGKSGTLNKITYPTGGWTNLLFEPHEVVLEAPKPFQVTESFSSPNEHRLKWTNMIDESQFNITYQFLKCAKDPSFNFYEKTLPVSQGDAIEKTVAIYEVFEVNFASVLNIDGWMKTHSGWDGLSYWASHPRVVLFNIHTGDEITLFTYADAPNDYGNSSSINNVSKTINITPGEYRVETRSVSIPPGENYEDYPPTPVVEFQTTQILLQTYESISDADLSAYIESFEIGGLRIQSIRNFNSDGSQVSRTDYDYNYPDALEQISSSGILMDDLIFHNKTSGFYSYNPREYGDFTLVENNQTGGNNSAQGSHIGYSLVREFNVAEDGKTNGWLERSFHNQKNGYFTDNIKLPYSYDYLEGNGDPYIRIFGTKFKWTCSGMDFGNNCAGTQRMTSTHGYSEIRNTVLLGLPLKYSFSHINGSVLEEKIYNENSSLLEKTKNEYTTVVGSVPKEHFSSFINIKIPTIEVQDGAALADIYSSWEEGVWGANHHSYYPYLFPQHHGQSSKLSSSRKQQFLENGELIVENIFSYNKLQHQLIKEVGLINENDTIIKKFFYPFDSEVFYDNGTSELRQENRLNEIIKATITKNNNLLNTKSYTYENSASTGNLTLVKSIKTAKANEEYRELYSYDKYDLLGNLVEISKPNGPHTVYIWGYNKQYPIAKIENGTYAEVSAALGGSLDTFNEANLPSINNLRTNATLAKAMITTYTYDPLVGVTSITDSKGLIQTFHYDAFNRLEFVKDHEGNILNESKYKYKIGQ